MVLSALISYVIVAYAKGSTAGIKVVKILRILRVLRPLKSINRLPRLKAVFDCVINSVSLGCCFYVFVGFGWGFCLCFVCVCCFVVFFLLLFGMFCYRYMVVNNYLFVVVIYEVYGAVEQR